MGLVTFMWEPHKWQEINWLEMSPVCIIQLVKNIYGAIIFCLLIYDYYFLFLFSFLPSFSNFLFTF